MRFYEYIYRDSIVHKLDPRTKLIWLIVFSALVFMTSNSFVIASLFVLTILIGVIAKIPKEQFWESTRFFIILMPIIYVLLYVVLSGFTFNSIIGGLVFAIKFLVLIFAAVIFTMTTSARDLLLALTKIKIPYAFGFMLTIAIRFIPVIIKEINSVIDAQRARAYEISFSLRHPIKSVEKFIPILIPVLTLLLKRSNELALSIDSRAFRAREKITFPERLKFKSYDWLFSVFLIAAFVFASLKF
jgi:energy-coupling factor transport system permease protein